jgi:hypothetical protein
MVVAHKNYTDGQVTFTAINLQNVTETAGWKPKKKKKIAQKNGLAKAEAAILLYTITIKYLASQKYSLFLMLGWLCSVHAFDDHPWLYWQTCKLSYFNHFPGHFNPTSQNGPLSSLKAASPWELLAHWLAFLLEKSMIGSLKQTAILGAGGGVVNLSQRV